MIDRPTPETEQWEAYCDECYYHWWGLRRKNETGWNDGFHIHTGEEAKGLCDLLNNLERDRDEAIIKYTSQANEYEKLIRELDEAREQRDRMAEALRKVGTSWNFVDIAREALRSLGTNAKTTNQND